MPPKKQVQEKKKKIVEDKTFGLKNKKGAKVQKYVQEVTKQAKEAGPRLEREAAEKRKAESAAKKKAEEDKKAELAELFKPAVQQQKVPFGVDPKTILCNFFKAGSCQKGNKCKFSHDLNIERKAQKINLYEDARDKKEDTMEDWDQAKLEEAVSKKHGKGSATVKPTEIVCKFFLEAIESRKYGWFWECPNGNDKCKYRHALPPGYVLKKKETEEERRAREENEKENAITIEDFLETERHNLGSNLTPVTAETFAQWKKERKEREANLDADKQKKKQEEYKKMRAGMKSGMTFSGKELFDFNPDWAQNGLEDDGAMDAYQRDPEDPESADQQVPNGSEKIKVWDSAPVHFEIFEGEEFEGLEDDDESEEEAVEA